MYLSNSHTGVINQYCYKKYLLTIYSITIDTFLLAFLHINICVSNLMSLAYNLT